MITSGTTILYPRNSQPVDPNMNPLLDQNPSTSENLWRTTNIHSTNVTYLVSSMSPSNTQIIAISDASSIKPSNEIILINVASFSH